MKNIIKKFSIFENKSENEIILENIEKYLLQEFDQPTWEKFIDNQELGDCQLIIDSIKFKFPNIKTIFGEIEIDHPYIDEYGDEQNYMTHHWIELDNVYYDFSKGTLRDYIDFDDYDLYSIETNESKYNAKTIKFENHQFNVDQAMVTERFQFNASTEFVDKILHKVKEQIVDKDLGNLEIEEILNKAFEVEGITFIYGVQDEYVRDDFAEVGIYHGFCQEDGAIFISYGKEFYQTFEDDYLWNNFRHVVKIIVAHEMVHRHQIRRMRQHDRHKYIKPVDMTSNFTYLSDKMEIAAFAKEAVTDYLNKGYSVGSIIQMLRNEKGNGIPVPQESEAYWKYFEYFNDYEPKIMHRFKKWMVQYMKSIH